MYGAVYVTYYFSMLRDAVYKPCCRNTSGLLGPEIALEKNCAPSLGFIRLAAFHHFLFLLFPPFPVIKTNRGCVQICVLAAQKYYSA